MSHDFQLSAQRVHYFETFGFLHLPGLFRSDAERLSAAFERIFADPALDGVETHNDVHGGRRRLIVTGFTEKDETLRPLPGDPRVTGIVRSLLGDQYEYADSDGNLWFCETYWHLDAYRCPISIPHVKLSFYLDPLSEQSGAIRLIPGSHFYTEDFARTLLRDLSDHATIAEIYGVDGSQIPSWTIESEPGDLIVWNQRALHASYNGMDRRRSFALTFRDSSSPLPNDQGDGAPPS